MRDPKLMSVSLIFDSPSCLGAPIVGVFDLPQFRGIIGQSNEFGRCFSTRHDQFGFPSAPFCQILDLIQLK